MKEIVSRKTGKLQIISDETWNNIVRRGWTNKFIVHEAPVKPAKNIPVITSPQELKKPPKKKKDG